MGEMHTIEAIRVSRDGTSSVVARLSRRLDRPRLQRIVAKLLATGAAPGNMASTGGANKELETKGAEVLRWDGWA